MDSIRKHHTVSTRRSLVNVFYGTQLCTEYEKKLSVIDQLKSFYSSLYQKSVFDEEQAMFFLNNPDVPKLIRQRI